MGELGLIHLLEIRQQQIQVGQTGLDMGPGHMQAGLHGGVDPLGLGCRQQLTGKLVLQEGFSYNFV